MVNVYESTEFEKFIDLTTRKPVNDALGLVSGQIAYRIVFSHGDVTSGEMIFAPNAEKGKLIKIYLFVILFFNIFFSEIESTGTNEIYYTVRYGGFRTTINDQEKLVKQGQ